jgi:hypothetical protein
LDPAASRDPAATDHKTTFAQLQGMAPHVRWEDYFEHLHLTKDVGLNVQEPKFLAEVDRQMQSTPLSDWKTYLKWQLLSSAASDLSEPFVEEDFAFNSKYLNGATEMKPRWKRCAESTDQLFGEALGKKYVEKYFPPEAKARMQEMIKNILAAMHDDILTLPWMSEETKKKALTKLSTFNVKVGYPIVKRVQKHFGKRLLFVFRNFPLNEIHAQAEAAAETAEFAAAHGKFWEMHDLLFENQTRFSPPLFQELAHELKLVPEELRQALASGTYRAHVRSDFMSGARSGVNGTPTFFINGQRHDGPFEYEDLVVAIDEALG